MANGHGGARAGAGRPPGAEQEWNQFDAIVDTYYWVEGRILIPAEDDDKRVLRDKLTVLLKEIGLTPQLAPVGSNYDTAPRRRWSTKAIPLWEVVAVVKDHPRQTTPYLAKEVYCSKFEWNNWTAEQQKQAETKLSVAMSKLVRDGRIIRRYNHEGKAVFFTKDHPAEEIAHYATTRGGRMQVQAPDPPKPELVLAMDEMRAELRSLREQLMKEKEPPKKKLEKSKR